MPGVSGLHLQLGDYIEFEAASCDPQVRPYGESWDAKQFLVYSVKHGMSGSKIKGIQLYE